MSKWYVLKLWYTTIFITGPAAALFYAFAVGNIPHADDAGEYLLLIPFGFVLSLPALIISGGCFVVLEHYQFSAIVTKWLVNVIIILCVWATFHLIGGSAATVLAIVYTTAIVLTSLFYRITRP